MRCFSPGPAPSCGGDPPSRGSEQLSLPSAPHSRAPTASLRAQQPSASGGCVPLSSASPPPFPAAPRAAPCERAVPRAGGSARPGLGGCRGRSGSCLPGRAPPGQRTANTDPTPPAEAGTRGYAQLPAGRGVSPVTAVRSRQLRAPAGTSHLPTPGLGWNHRADGAGAQRRGREDPQRRERS